MADRTPLLLSKEEEGQALGKDEQLMEFVVKCEEVVDGVAVDSKPLPLFRVRASVSQIEAGKLSGFWEDVRKSMHPAFDQPKDIEAARKGQLKTALRAVRRVEGVCNEKTNEYVKHLMTTTPANYAYKATDMKGSFCFDADLKETAPLGENNIYVFKHALKNQLHEESMGDASAGKIKYLWSPLEEGDEDADSTIKQYAENLAEFEKWKGRIVHWEFVEYDPKGKRA